MPYKEQREYEVVVQITKTLSIWAANEEDAEEWALEQLHDDETPFNSIEVIEINAL